MDIMQLLFNTNHETPSGWVRVAAPFAGLEDFDYGLRRALDPQFDWEAFGKLLIENTAEHVLTVTEDIFELQYALFRIPDEPEAVFLMAPGPTAPAQRKPATGYAGISARKPARSCRAITAVCVWSRTTALSPPSV